MPILKLIGPVPATAWIPCGSSSSDDLRQACSSSRFWASVAILTSSGVASVNRAYYDVGAIWRGEWSLCRRSCTRVAAARVRRPLHGALLLLRRPCRGEMLGANSALVGTSSSRLRTRVTRTSMRRSSCGPHLRRHRQFVLGDRLLGWQRVHLMAATAALRAAVRGAQFNRHSRRKPIELDGSHCGARVDRPFRRRRRVRRVAWTVGMREVDAAVPHLRSRAADKRLHFG